MDIYSVSKLNNDIRLALEQQFGNVWLVGEVSNFAAPGSGHWYFTLKDDKAQIRCAMFRGNNQRAKIRPQNGVQVLVRARVTVYAPRGDYQLIVEHIEDAGQGLLQQQFEQLKVKLAAEGLFANERKRPLPTDIRRVGVVTSPTGAAIQDILAVMKRRDPNVEVIIYPSAVQGEAAIPQLKHMLHSAFVRNEVDVLIVSRGGGSIEDLWCFNDEGVARMLVDAPMPVIAARSPADAFEVAIEACRIATQYMTPVMLLTDGYIANAAEPWKVPDPETFEKFPARFLEEKNDGENLLPYKRDEKGARPWIKPGTPGLMHRVGGIEKNIGTGNIDYSPENHQAMTDARKAKIDNITVPDQQVAWGEDTGELAVVGWGSTYGPIKQAVRRWQEKGKKVSHIHVRHIWPLPKNLGELLSGFDKVLVPEMNTGQFKTVLRDQLLIDAESLTKTSGQPFQIAELEAAIGKFFDNVEGNEGGEIEANEQQLPNPVGVEK